MQEVYVIIDEYDGTIVGVTTTLKGARQVMVRYALSHPDCDILDTNIEQDNDDPLVSYYRIDFLHFVVTETRLIDN